MKTWLLSVGAMILLTALITLILPNGRTNKLIRSVFALLTLLVIVQPLVSLKTGEAEIVIPSITNDNEIYLQEDFLGYIIEKRNENKEKECGKILSEKGINGAFVEIGYITDGKASYEIKKVTVNLTESVIFPDKEHIDIIEVIRTEIADYLKTDKEVIYIYE